MENFLNAVVFPFAFDPENSLSRNAKWLNEKTLKISFDMTIENAPKCAGIALLLDINSIPSKVIFKAKQNFLFPPHIMMVLKKGTKKVQYFENEVSFSSSNVIYLKKFTSEISFNCWNSINEYFCGDIIISFE